MSGNCYVLTNTRVLSLWSILHYSEIDSEDSDINATELEEFQIPPDKHHTIPHSQMQLRVCPVFENISYS